MDAAMATSRYLAATTVPIKPAWSKANIITLSRGFESTTIPIAPISINTADILVRFMKSRGFMSFTRHKTFHFSDYKYFKYYFNYYFQ